MIRLIPARLMALCIACLLMNTVSAGPLEDLLVSDIGSIVLVDAAIPPDTAKSFSAYNCHFQALDWRCRGREADGVLRRADGLRRHARITRFASPRRSRLAHGVIGR